MNIQRRQFLISLGATSAFPVFFGSSMNLGAETQTPHFGHFDGSLLLTDADISECTLGEYETGANFKTVGNFSFTDPDSIEWVVPSGSCVNGASIPWIFQTIIGSPWNVEYRRAAVVHDYFCFKKTKSAETTHLSFYFALRAEGVAEWKAKAMYKAVLYFGPYWYVTIKKKPIRKNITKTKTVMKQHCSNLPFGHKICFLAPTVESYLEPMSVEVDVPEIIQSSAKYEAIDVELFSEKNIRKQTLMDIFNERPDDRRQVR